MHARYVALEMSGEQPRCPASRQQKAAVERLLSHLDEQRHSGTLFKTQTWVTCAEVAMNMAVDLRSFAPRRLHHIVVARHACASVG